MTTHGIVSITDTSIGYGTPQTPWFLQSLAEHYDTRAFVLEPDEIHRPPLENSYDRLDVVRASTAQRAHSLASYLDRNWRLVDHLQKNEAPIWVIFSPLQLAALSRVKHKPRYIVYYCLEIGDRFYARALQEYGQHIDHIIFPELERAALTLKSLNPSMKAKSSILYNATKRDPGFVLPDKKPRVIYAGSLSWRYTFADEFTDELRDLPIDIYGPIDDAERQKLAPAFEAIRNAAHGVSYKGYLPGAALRKILPSYAYSIVRWNLEMGLNYYYACPNKLFEGIAHGVPPIAAPHPQCVQILRKYECGLLAEDFSAEGMKAAIRRGLDLLGTSAYDRMVQNGLDAHDNFLNWDSQFARFAPALPSKTEMGL